MNSSNITSKSSSSAHVEASKRRKPPKPLTEPPIISERSVSIRDPELMKRMPSREVLETGPAQPSSAAISKGVKENGGGRMPLLEEQPKPRTASLRPQKSFNNNITNNMNNVSKKPPPPSNPPPPLSISETKNSYPNNNHSNKNNQEKVSPPKEPDQRNVEAASSLPNKQQSTSKKPASNKLGYATLRRRRKGDTSSKFLGGAYLPNSAGTFQESDLQEPEWIDDEPQQQQNSSKVSQLSKSPSGKRGILKAKSAYGMASVPASAPPRSLAPAAEKSAGRDSGKLGILDARFSYASDTTMDFNNTLRSKVDTSSVEKRPQKLQEEDLRRNVLKNQTWKPEKSSRPPSLLAPSGKNLDSDVVKVLDEALKVLCSPTSPSPRNQPFSSNKDDQQVRVRRLTMQEVDVMGATRDTLVGAAKARKSVRWGMDTIKRHEDNVDPEWEDEMMTPQYQRQNNPRGADSNPMSSEIPMYSPPKTPTPATSFQSQRQQIEYEDADDEIQVLDAYQISMPTPPLQRSNSAPKLPEINPHNSSILDPVLLAAELVSNQPNRFSVNSVGTVTVILVAPPKTAESQRGEIVDADELEDSVRKKERSRRGGGGWRRGGAFGRRLVFGLKKKSMDQEVESEELPPEEVMNDGDGKGKGVWKNLKGKFGGFLKSRKGSDVDMVVSESINKVAEVSQGYPESKTETNPIAQEERPQKEEAGWAVAIPPSQPRQQQQSSLPQTPSPVQVFVPPPPPAAKPPSKSQLLQPLPVPHAPQAPPPPSKTSSSPPPPPLVKPTTKEQLPVITPRVGSKADLSSTRTNKRTMSARMAKNGTRPLRKASDESSEGGQADKKVGSARGLRNGGEGVRDQGSGFKKEETPIVESVAIVEETNKEEEEKQKTVEPPPPPPTTFLGGVFGLFGGGSASKQEEPAPPTFAPKTEPAQKPEDFIAPKPYQKDEISSSSKPLPAWKSHPEIPSRRSSRNMDSPTSPSPSSSLPIPPSKSDTALPLKSPPVPPTRNRGSGSYANSTSSLPRTPSTSSLDTLAGKQPPSVPRPNSKPLPQPYRASRELPKVPVPPQAENKMETPPAPLKKEESEEPKPATTFVSMLTGFMGGGKSTAKEEAEKVESVEKEKKGDTGTTEVALPLKKLEASPSSLSDTAKPSTSSSAAEKASTPIRNDDEKAGVSKVKEAIQAFQNKENANAAFKPYSKPMPRSAETNPPPAPKTVTPMPVKTEEPKQTLEASKPLVIPIRSANPKEQKFTVPKRSDSPSKQLVTGLSPAGTREKLQNRDLGVSDEKSAAKGKEKEKQTKEDESKPGPKGKGDGDDGLLARLNRLRGVAAAMKASSSSESKKEQSVPSSDDVKKDRTGTVAESSKKEEEETSSKPKWGVKLPFASKEQSSPKATPSSVPAPSTATSIASVSSQSTSPQPPAPPKRNSRPTQPPSQAFSTPPSPPLSAPQRPSSPVSSSKTSTMNPTFENPNVLKTPYKSSSPSSLDRVSGEQGKKPVNSNETGNSSVFPSYSGSGASVSSLGRSRQPGAGSTSFGGPSPLRSTLRRDQVGGLQQQQQYQPSERASLTPSVLEKIAKIPKPTDSDRDSMSSYPSSTLTRSSSSSSSFDPRYSQQSNQPVTSRSSLYTLDKSSSRSNPNLNSQYYARKSNYSQASLTPSVMAKIASIPKPSDSDDESIMEPSFAPSSTNGHGNDNGSGRSTTPSVAPSINGYASLTPSVVEKLKNLPKPSDDFDDEDMDEMMGAAPLPPPPSEKDVSANAAGAGFFGFRLW
ncbi:hypothetical protein HDV05_005578 [Chytridiales sp. JEL 0842]|nr:hypothetical protein HDV05_005578 [Chytridiales sp. JEL 0842]